jgi:ribonuclease VapC
MVIDSSAVTAILLDEPERGDFDLLIEADSVGMISVVGRVEAGMVIAAKKADQGRVSLDRFLRLTAAEILPVIAEQAETALEAVRRFGKGHRPASLNIGHCFAYAADKAKGQKLLFMGADFAPTDIPVAAQA